MVEILNYIILAQILILIVLFAVAFHKIHKIQKQIIEEEREARKQPEFWDENAI